MGFDVKIGTDYNWNSIDYSIEEDATPVDPSDSSGGSGQITVKLPHNSSTKGLKGKTLTIEDDLQGTTIGRISQVSTDGTEASITADERLILLAAKKTALPYKGTLEGAFRYYIGLCGITSQIVVTASAAARQVTLLGWKDVVLDQLKKLCAANRVEMSLVSNNVVLRDLRNVTAYNYRNADVSWTEDDTNVVQNVGIYQYDPSYVTNKIAYPADPYDKSINIIQADAREQVTVNLSLDATDDEPNGVSLASLIAPSPTDYTNAYDITHSQYAVVDKDGKHVLASEWAAKGGKVTATIDNDTRGITVIVTGMNDYDRAPFRLALPDVNGDLVNSLHILGTGVFYTKNLKSYGTGANPNVYTEEQASTIDNEFLTGADGNIHGFLAASRYGGSVNKLTVDTEGVNNTTTTNSLRYQLASDFNLEYSGMTIHQFNTQWAGSTIKQYNDSEIAKVRDTFDFQIFGNVGGARTVNDFCFYRIITATIDSEHITYDAVQDNTVRDFNAIFSGMTIHQFNTAWAGKTIYEFNLRPMQFGKEIHDLEQVPTTKAFSAAAGGTFGYGGYGEGGYGGS